jgi:hypothetical protein
MSKKLIPMKTAHEVCWVAADGSWGMSHIILFDADDLTQHQHDVLAELGDYDRMEYVRAILDGDNQTVMGIEAENDIANSDN